MLVAAAFFTVSDCLYAQIFLRWQTGRDDAERGSGQTSEGSKEEEDASFLACFLTPQRITALCCHGERIYLECKEGGLYSAREPFLTAVYGVERQLGINEFYLSTAQRSRRDTVAYLCVPPPALPPKRGPDILRGLESVHITILKPLRYLPEARQ